MSAGLTESDSMFSVRKAPWDGLGAVLEEPATVAKTIDASGLGWSVAKERIAVDRGDEPDDDWLLPRCEQIPGYYATVRQDNREVLGIVGERYRIVQNQEAFAFIDQLLGSSIHFETAVGSHGGRRVWVLATLPEHVEVGQRRRRVRRLAAPDALERSALRPRARRRTREDPRAATRRGCMTWAGLAGLRCRLSLSRSTRRSSRVLPYNEC